MLLEIAVPVNMSDLLIENFWMKVFAFSETSVKC